MAKKTDTAPAAKPDPATQTEIERLQAQLAAMRGAQPAAAAPPPPPPPTPTPAPEPAKADEKPAAPAPEQPAPTVRQVVIEDAGPPPAVNPEEPEPVKVALTDKVKAELEAGRRKVAEHTKYAAAAQKAAKKDK